MSSGTGDWGRLRRQTGDAAEQGSRDVEHVTVEQAKGEIAEKQSEGTRAGELLMGLAAWRPGFSGG